MQVTLIENQQNEKDLIENSIPANFKRPVFIRHSDLLVDIYDGLFPLTEADMHQGPASALKPGADMILKKSFRVIIAKPLVDIHEQGTAIQKVLAHYQIKNPAKQLIVAFNDLNTLPGTISVQHGSDVRGADKHPGLKSVMNALGSSDFIRY